MTKPVILTTKQAIGAVYDWLGGPDKSILPASRVCTKFWAMLGKVQGKQAITDKTHYLYPHEFTLGANTLEHDLGDLPVNFGDALGFEYLDTTTGVERAFPFPLISDFRDKDNTGGLCAFIYRDGEGGERRIRFNQPLPKVYRFRLWVEPAAFARPGLSEVPFIPEQALNYAILETASACLPDIAKVYDATVYRAYADEVRRQALEFRQIFETWSMKNPGAGVREKKSFNHNRRRRGFGDRVRFDYGE